MRGKRVKVSMIVVVVWVGNGRCLVSLRVIRMLRIIIIRVIIKSGVWNRIGWILLKFW